MIITKKSADKSETQQLQKVQAQVHNIQSQIERPIFMVGQKIVGKADGAI
jgi:hypothetical protein